MKQFLHRPVNQKRPIETMIRQRGSGNPELNNLEEGRRVTFIREVRFLDAGFRSHVNPDHSDHV